MNYMNTEVFLTSSNVTEEDVKDKTVIVIDVLRASSTIATALSNGARAVVPAPDMAEAGKIASNMDHRSFLMGGEKGGEKIEGYHLGNSPLEYLQDTVHDRTIIFNTTNGTRAIARARSAHHLVIGCFLNASRVAAFARSSELDVIILCAGWRNRVSLEDTLCAGLLLDLLLDGSEPDVLSDTARIAYSQYRYDCDDLDTALRRAHHARWLSSRGHADDVDYCFRIDALPVLPVYEDSRLVLLKTHEKAAAS